LNIYSLIESIGNVLYKRDIYGYVTVDFVAFKDPNNLDSHPLFWAIDIDLYITNPNNIHNFYNFLLDGEMDANGCN